MEIIFTKRQNMSLPSERLPLHEANQHLIACNQELLTDQERGECAFELYLDNQNLPTYTDTWVFPSPDFDFIQSIEKHLVEEERTPEMHQFLTLLEKAINQPVKKEKVKKSMGRGVFLKVGLLIICVVLGSDFFFTIQTQTKVTDLETNQHELERRLATKDQVDVFGRYFLTNFYSFEIDEEKYKEKNHSFLSEELIDEISVPSQRAINILTWKIDYSKDEWQLSYIVTLENKAEERTTQKLSFNVKEIGSEAYQVVSFPSIKEFQINEE